MATELWSRRWAVTIGPPGGEGRVWVALDIRFRVEKSGTSTPNKLTLAIYNLSADSQAFVEKKGNAVLLEAGYEDELRLLFTGELRLAGTQKGGNHGQKRGERLKDGPDWLTEIEGADGFGAYRTVMHESFGAGTTESSVMRAIAKKMGVTLGSLQGLSDEPYRNGRVLTGPARLQLEAMCRSRGLRWSIQDGVLNILPIGTAAGSGTILLDPGSGLIGSPERTETGIRLTSLLRGGINPGTLLQVDSRNVDGNYVAEKVVHEGESAGQPWYTHIDAIPAG